mgnify:CR=1 FL=1
MAGANHGKNWIATWIFGIYKCHLRKIPSSSELSKGECSKVRSSISPTKLAAKISRSQLSSISVPSFLRSFFWRSFLFSFSLPVSETETSQMELLEVAFPSIPSRSARAKFIVFLLLLPRSPSDKFNSSPERFIFKKKKLYFKRLLYITSN